MTPEETKKAAETMLAHAEGKEIEILVYDYNGRKEWGDCKNPDWNWDSHDYRIKPQRVSIPTTEEDIAVIQNYTFVKDKNTGKIYPAAWEEFTQLPHNHKRYLIYNPDTKCWEDWKEDTNKEERLRHHYNGGQP